MQIFYPSSKRKHTKSLDSVISMLMFVTGQNLEDSVQIFQDLSLRKGQEDQKYHRNASVYYTMNPLIIDYLDIEYAKKYIYFHDNIGSAVQLGSDKLMCERISYMMPSAAILADDRVMI